MSLLDELPQTRMRTLVTAAQHSEWRELRDAWKNARAAVDRDDSDRNTEAEQRAYDSWCDWIEENNLNYSAYDPRGRTDYLEEERLQQDAQEWAQTLIRGDQIFLAESSKRRRWTVRDVTSDAVNVIRTSGPTRFQTRKVTGAKLVAVMKANQA